jgi:hypothetical protein
MEKMMSAELCQPYYTEPVLIIPREFFNALHPYDKAMALALSKVGEVRILDEDDKIVVR